MGRSFLISYECTRAQRAAQHLAGAATARLPRAAASLAAGPSCELNPHSSSEFKIEFDFVCFGCVSLAEAQEEPNEYARQSSSRLAVRIAGFGVVCILHSLPLCITSQLSRSVCPRVAAFPVTPA